MQKIGIAKTEERANWSYNGREFPEVNDRYQNKGDRGQGLTYRRTKMRIRTDFFSNATSTSM